MNGWGCGARHLPWLRWKRGSGQWLSQVKASEAWERAVDIELVWRECGVCVGLGRGRRELTEQYGLEVTKDMISSRSK